MFSRRDFLKTSASITGSLLVSTAITGCSLGLGRAQLSSASFDHGVASGDPLEDAVIIWTRAQPQPGESPESLSLVWELASDETFGRVLRNGAATAARHRDYTVKIDVRDLEPGKTYFYRFQSSNTVSPAGRIKTLPLAGVNSVKFAVVSCSNYPAGYFHVYREASRVEHLDAVLHLGDYIYEYGSGGYATERAEELGRELSPNNNDELITLDDYRKRYALYRRDPDLQALHAAAPFIVVWDDHEITNDAWMQGAENHDPSEGAYQPRKEAAIRAYYEWLPIRPPQVEDKTRIYRSFNFGDLVALHMLDTRIIGRDQQLDYKNYRDEDSGEFDQRKFGKNLSDPSRRLMGEAQLNWLSNQLKSSQAKWQILGQQVLMARMWMPAEVFSAKNYAAIPPMLNELGAIKSRQLNGMALSSLELKRITQLTPYNLDAWDGYPAERGRLYAAVTQAGHRLVSLAGDTHNAWFSHLTTREGQKIGVELATASVSSPGMESYFSMTPKESKDLAKNLPLLIEDLKYCNLHQRGFLLMTVTDEDILAQWHFIDGVFNKEYQVVDVHEERVKL